MKVLITVVALSVLIIIHEGGHYLAARAFGMRVLRYSIGFGPTLFRYQPKGSPTVFQVAAIPFLLNMFRIPADLMQLFFVSGIYVARLGDMLGAMHILFVSVLTAAALNNMFIRRWAKLGRILLGVAAICVVGTIGSRTLLMFWSGQAYNRDQVVPAGRQPDRKPDAEGSGDG